jgi:CheY-like chemotaxis protein
MGAKRALIVDDSKSARLFLARMLEKYEIDVDSAENAEAAIQYLASHRPDVIFMDHLMPGMDGFQAVQAIKNNPLTATIPILMYTSQEGELYLGQARALGAVGVLPKQIKPADVSKILYQLHLLADRRSSFQGSFRPLNVPAPGETPLDQSAANDSGVLPKVLTETALRDQFAELRRALVAGVDTQTERITAEVRALLLEALPPAAPLGESNASLPLRAPIQFAWVVASLSLAIACATTALWWQQAAQLQTLGTQVEALRRSITVQPGAAGVATAVPGPAPTDTTPKTGTVDGESSGNEGLKTGSGGPSNASAGSGNGSAGGTNNANPSQASSQAFPTESKPLVISVPYGADALGGSRLDSIRQLLDRLVKDNHSGVVDIKSFPGRFCLMGNVNDGYSLAPDETPFAKCDVVGNPSDEALSAAQRMPLQFANLVGGVRNASHGSVDVQPSSGDATTVIAPYPTVSPGLTAGEWNRAGGANNRVEIRVH